MCRRRGVVVGERTFGKGLVQQVARLPFETSLKLTVAKYYTPSGRCIQSVEYKEGGLDNVNTQSGDEEGGEGGKGGQRRRNFRFGDSFRSRTYQETERKTFTTDKGRVVNAPSHEHYDDDMMTMGAIIIIIIPSHEHQLRASPSDLTVPGAIATPLDDVPALVFYSQHIPQ